LISSLLVGACDRAYEAPSVRGINLVLVEQRARGGADLDDPAVRRGPKDRVRLAVRKIGDGLETPGLVTRGDRGIDADAQRKGIGQENREQRQAGADSEFVGENGESVRRAAKPGNQEMPVSIDQGADNRSHDIGRPVAELLCDKPPKKAKVHSSFRPLDYCCPRNPFAQGQA
jgi:hypothetical protein